MFGDNDTGSPAPQDNSSTPSLPAQDDGTLNGVADLANGGTMAAPSEPAGNNDGGFMPMPSEPPQASTPEPTTPEPATEATPAPAADDLLEIKQQALQQLTPLVGHLDQTSEEKFRTSMMLIQASDNQALLKDAFEAAQQISDDKVRAQALLDVINEINYFTQNKQ